MLAGLQRSSVGLGPIAGGQAGGHLAGHRVVIAGMVNSRHVTISIENIFKCGLLWIGEARMVNQIKISLSAAPALALA